MAQVLVAERVQVDVRVTLGNEVPSIARRSAHVLDVAPELGLGQGTHDERARLVSAAGVVGDRQGTARARNRWRWRGLRAPRVVVPTTAAAGGGDEAAEQRCGDETDASADRAVGRHHHRLCCSTAQDNGRCWATRVSGIRIARTVATNRTTAQAPKPAPYENWSARNPATRGPMIWPPSDAIWNTATTRPPRPCMMSPTTAPGAV